MGFSGDGGPAIEAAFRCPGGLAVDQSGNLLVVDNDNHRVRQIDANGVITTVVSSGAGFGGDGGPATGARLFAPWGIAVGSDGALYVADRDNNRVRRVDADGIITTVAGNGRAEYSGDGGPAVEAGLHDPLGVAVDEAGNVFVADSNNNRVRRIDAQGVITTVAGTGELASSGDGGPAEQATLADPQHVILDGEGNLIVVETAGHRLRLIDSAGQITTIAGTGEPGFSGDGGPASEAQISDPSAVAIDEQGNIYIPDRGNRCVRVIDQSGTITSLWCGPR